MSTDPEAFSNYFNYFTEIEEHFQKGRGTSLFLLSPLDWALIETWKNAGVPLEAVLRGIDVSFEKWRARRTRAQMVNSLAYCAQAVLAEAQRMADSLQQADSGRTTTEEASGPAFKEDQLRQYIQANARALRATSVPDFAAVADSLDTLLTELSSLCRNPESLEVRLSVLEQRMIAAAKSREPEEQALRTRMDLDKYLRPWRSKMSAPQLAMLEAQFIDRAVLEAAGLPRLSLFYLQG